MRTKTPVPLIGRRLEKEKILDNGMVLPKGMDVDINITAVHNDEEEWEEPEKFNPDRFDKSKKRHPYAFIPFSAGPR